MKFFKAYITMVIIGFLLVVVLMVSTKDEGNTLTNANQENYSQNWTILSGGEEKHYRELPDSVSRKDGQEKFVLKKRLPDKIAHGDTIAFYIGHNIIHASVGNREVYSFDVPEVYKKVSKTPGTTWCFINLIPEDAGKTIAIELKPVYNQKRQNLPEMIYGDRAKIVVEIIASRAPALVISCLIFALGLAIIVGLLLFKQQLRAPDYMYWLGIFAIKVSLWSCIQTQVLTLIYAQNIRGNQISFLIFQMLLIPLISFVKNFCEVNESKTYEGLVIANVILLVGTTVLQFAGIKDYSEMILGPYLLYLAGFIWMLVTVIGCVIRGKKKERRRMITQGLILLLLLFSIMFDMIGYLRGISSDSARLSRIALLIYIVAMICMIFRHSIHLIHLGEQFESMSKEAMHDALTKLLNRTAFERDMAEYLPGKASSAIMFDLNNLKYFNDVHGHATGDYYIIVCSEIIQDIFGLYGKVYRIGGDEFCAIAEGIDEEKFMELRRGMNDRIEALNGRFFENKMSVASGYACYDMQSARSILDTVKCADMKMYECKAAMKGR